jgi:hypothetical protein
MKRLQQWRQPVIPRIALRTEPQHALPVLRHQAQIVFGATDVVENATRGAEHALASRREHHALAKAQEELHCKSGLDVAQLMRQCRLRQVKTLGSPRDAAGRRDLVNERKMTDF